MTTYKRFTTTDKTPWYSQFWPWFIISIPLASFFVGGALVYFSTQKWDGLVTDDYYQQGLTINVGIEKRERAKELGLSADIKFTSSAISIKLHAKNPDNLPKFINVKIFHPTVVGQDQELHLMVHDGEYTGLFRSLAGVEHWKIAITDEKGVWRLDALYYPKTNKLTWY